MSKQKTPQPIPRHVLSAGPFDFPPRRLDLEAVLERCPQRYREMVALTSENPTAVVSVWEFQVGTLILFADWLALMDTTDIPHPCHKGLRTSRHGDRVLKLLRALPALWNAPTRRARKAAERKVIAARDALLTAIFEAK